MFADQIELPELGPDLCSYYGNDKELSKNTDNFYKQFSLGSDLLLDISAVRFDFLGLYEICSFAFMLHFFKSFGFRIAATIPPFSAVMYLRGYYRVGAAWVPNRIQYTARIWL